MVADVPAEILFQRLQEFIKLWAKYIDLFNHGVDGHEPTIEEEKEFRKLQVELTRRSQFLSLAVPNGIFNQWPKIKKLLGDTPSLLILSKEVPIQISSFKSLWHDVSIALNQKQGAIRQALEERESKKVRKK
ncbi:MAG: hypothetical protein RBU29_05230 [bacterium]|jgi:hypothetical protein|nr:hypothetical protein [bacterium]